MTGNSTLDQLREATRLANEVLKDLKAERKAIAEERKAIEDLVKGLREGIEELFASAVDEGLQSLGNHIDKTIEAASEMVMKRFDTMSDNLLGEMNKNDRPSLEEMLTAVAIAQRARKHGLPEEPMTPMPPWLNKMIDKTQ